MDYACIVVRYAEIAIKGKNKNMFVGQLVKNIQSVLRDKNVGEIVKLRDRILVLAKADSFFDEETFERLQLVYGIASLSPALRCDTDLESLQKNGLRVVETLEYKTFRVRVRRVDKRIPLRSMDAARDIAAYILPIKEAEVKMKGAECELFVDLLDTGGYVYTQKIQGPGGLPVGVTGSITVMLSGGIDSPVAAARMLKRGCYAHMVHFHSHPFVTRASWEKAEELAEVIAKRQGTVKLYGVAFGELQREIVDKAPMKLRIVLYRRFMVRIAAAIGDRHRAKALVTGEALAQVASQTLTNMVVIDEASPLPILRPLVGYDKQEIINEAQALGTFEISIQPDQDCCTLFTPRHPETHAKMYEVVEAESKMDIEALVKGCVENVEAVTIHAPWVPAGDGES